jgi:hypothetical protein
MCLHLPIMALLIIAALSARAPLRVEGADTAPLQGPTNPTHTEHADPMAPFARMIPGEWRMTAEGGTSMYDTWRWGPGRHSVRVMTDGFGADGAPWREVQVYYWHPGRKEIRLLGLSPFARGVSEGTIKFQADTAVAAFDIHQTRGRRELALHWSFDGPDTYRETLLEKNDADVLIPLVEWRHIRSDPPADALPPAGDEMRLAERLKALAPLLAHQWVATGDRTSGQASPIRSTFQWVPYADAIYARTWTPAADGVSKHLLDTYLYHHTGANSLRALALSDRGGVYEGDLTVLDGGNLQLDLTGSEADKTVHLVVRLDFDADGSMRQRVWSGSAAEGTPVLDLRHRKADPEND